MSVDKKSLLAFANAERDRFESALREFVEIPSVSADPERQPDIRRCAERAANIDWITSVLPITGPADAQMTRSPRA